MTDRFKDQIRRAVNDEADGRPYPVSDRERKMIACGAVAGAAMLFNRAVETDDMEALKEEVLEASHDVQEWPE